MSTEQTSWTSLSTVQKIALGLGIPASATVAYILYRRYRESRGMRAHDCACGGMQTALWPWEIGRKTVLARLDVICWDVTGFL